ncbi:FtsX-like permease family protein [Tropicimonas marinistellae]|uniref:FtsX-like permease family protein n=1 Tax=Tropicimonas marinistellae TaxID=1739787 RepID=UPI00083376EC|nr:FtsX-like permease family protein [Tropicimonas marinistellae]
MADLWVSLPNGMQDLALFFALLAPALVTGLLTLRGFAPWGLLRGMLRRHFWVSITFIVLIATSVAIGTGLIAQERGLRRGTAQAADKFDLIVAAPGSEITAMLAAVYLQPSDIPLLDGETYQRIAEQEHVSLAAPIAFGDSWNASPVVGTTPQFVAHLSGTLAEGEVFTTVDEAVAGANVPLAIGDTFTPSHGHGDATDDGAHAGYHYIITGRMEPTGSPWDRAILVPVEGVWLIHGMPNGHDDGWSGDPGPPFDPAYFPGTPAILVRAEQLWANYALQSAFTTSETMAFFPGAVLARLHSLLGDVRDVMSMLAAITQVVVAAGVLTGLVILMRLLARRLALLRALGAPRRFVFALVWSFAATLLGTGTAIGLALGMAAATVISRIVSERTDILIRAQLGWPELHLVAAFFSITVLLALVPALLALRRAPVADLRST